MTAMGKLLSGVVEVCFITAFEWNKIITCTLIRAYSITDTWRY